MTKQEWVHKIASYMAGQIEAGDLEQASGVNASSLSNTEFARAEWAMGEVQRRLYRMGKR